MQNFLSTLYTTDPDLAAALEQLVLDQWVAVAVGRGYSWQSIEKLSAVARDRELLLDEEEKEADENCQRLCSRE